jgi:hypothetical protein
MEFTVKQINETIKRARKLYPNQCYMGRRLNVLRSIKEQMEPPYNRTLSESQVRYLKSLMASFSDEDLTKAENWTEEWKGNKELRERGDIISKYYIANNSWFMEIARTVQRNLQDEANPTPDFHMFHKMILNEYADKVWQSYTGKHIWNVGDLVCCRATAKVDGWTYQLRREGINLNSDPCMVLEADSKPITNATKYNEKTGGCRWISINPIGTTHIFQVMEKDLKKYRQPKKRSKK